MTAAQINGYGGVEVITINSDPSRPTPREGQVLVEVRAASLNPIDWKIRAGYLKDMVPLSFPVTLGGDFAGVVVETDAGVTDVKVGDEVYGSAIVLAGGSGSFADIAAANATSIARKPSSVNFEDAAGFPLVGVSAIQALEEHMKLQPGQKILIHGGAGGIGHMAIQLAKAIGATVVTTVRSEDREFVTALGADEVIDYTSQRFEDLVKGCDAVYDTVGEDVTDKSFLVLKKDGVLVSMLGQPNADLAKKHSVTAIGQNTQINTSRLTRLAQLVDAGTLKVHIDRVFPLDRVRDAFQLLETGHPRGKIVLTT